MPKITLKLGRPGRGGQTQEQIERKQLQKLFKDVVDASINMEEGDRYVAGPFLRIPSKKDYPDYEKVVRHPISLHEIKYKTNPRKTKIADFPTLREFLQMYKLMADNAATYNGYDTEIAEDARTLYAYAKKECEAFVKKQRDGTLEDGVKVEPKEEEDAEEEEAEAAEEEDEGVENEDEEDEEDGEEDEEGGEDDEYTDPPEAPAPLVDYTSDLTKVLKSVINFKSSHHKNSLKLSLPFMDPVDAREYPDYYTIVKKGMSFSDIDHNLAAGEYSNGQKGIDLFVEDVKLIFDNACTYNAVDSAIYRDARTLDGFLDKRIDKLQTTIANGGSRGAFGRPAGFARARAPKRPAPMALPPRHVGPGRPKKRGRGRPPKYPKPEQLELVDEDDVFGPSTIPLVSGEVPAFIRRHEVEKAEAIEAVDDITAFIKRFTFSTAMKRYQGQEVSKYFELCMIEPAGSTTIGGSTYSVNLPGDQVVGQPLVVAVSLQNRIVDEKYTTDLKVNKEPLKPQPTVIRYDEDGDLDGEFMACRYEFKLGLGLNLFEFQLKVPFPLKRAKHGDGGEDEDAMEIDEDETGASRRSTRNSGKRRDADEGGEADADAQDEDKDEQQFFQESVKVWVKVA